MHGAVRIIDSDSREGMLHALRLIIVAKSGADMSWEEYVRKVVPYTPGEQPKIKNIIKLNTNENPYPPSPLVYKAYEETELSDFRKFVICSDPDFERCFGKRADKKRKLYNGMLQCNLYMYFS